MIPAKNKGNNRQHLELGVGRLVHPFFVEKDDKTVCEGRKSHKEVYGKKKETYTFTYSSYQHGFIKPRAK